MVEKIPDSFESTAPQVILVVDDEKPIIDLQKKLLEGLGYRITTMTSSVDALERFKRDPDAFDLIISDMTMPNMNGAVLSRKLLAARRDIPIILCTGFSDLIDKEKAQEMGIRQYVMKPIIRREIAKIIREVLDIPPN